MLTKLHSVTFSEDHKLKGNVCFYSFNKLV